MLLKFPESFRTRKHRHPLGGVMVTVFSVLAMDTLIPNSQVNLNAEGKEEITEEDANTLYDLIMKYATKETNVFTTASSLPNASSEPERSSV